MPSSIHPSISLHLQFTIAAQCKASLKPACMCVCVLVYVCNLGLGLPVWCSLFCLWRKERMSMLLSNGAEALSLRPSVLLRALFTSMYWECERVCVCVCVCVCVHVHVWICLKSPQLLRLHGQANAVGTMSACVNVPFHLVTTEIHAAQRRYRI